MASPTTKPLKIITGADQFGTQLKNTLINHLNSRNNHTITIQDLGTSSYYTIAAQVGHLVSSAPACTTRGLVACGSGTGIGVSIFANKFPGVFAAACMTPEDAVYARSNYNCNVLALSEMESDADKAVEIIDAWLNTEFKASENMPWSDEFMTCLHSLVDEMARVGNSVSEFDQNIQFDAKLGLSGPENGEKSGSRSGSEFRSGLESGLFVKSYSNGAKLESEPVFKDNVFAESMGAKPESKAIPESGPKNQVIGETDLQCVISEFELDTPAVIESGEDGGHKSGPESWEVDGCSICSLVKNREFHPIDIPGGSINIVRKSPTSAFVRFKAGSVEPAHHHTYGHCLVVKEGKKRAWNLTKSEVFDMSIGDYLYIPAGDVHRALYYEDTKFFIKWDGFFDVFLDENVETAWKAVLDDDLDKA